MLVRYEDLRDDTLGAMRRVYSELGMEAGGDALARAVEKHSWEAIPEDMKGQEVLPEGLPRGLGGGPHPQAGGDSRGDQRPLLDEFYSRSRRDPAG